MIERGIRQTPRTQEQGVGEVDFSYLVLYLSLGE